MLNLIHPAAPAALPEFRAEIAALVKQNLTPQKLQEQISTYHEKDMALALPLLSREEQRRLFHVLPVQTLAAVLEYTEERAVYFDLLGIRQKTQVLSHMDTAAAAELLGQLPKQTRASVLELLPPEIRQELTLIRSFDEDQIGSRMSTNFIQIADSATVKSAMSQLICQAAEHDNISTLYLVNVDKTFCGAIDLKDLIIARENTPLAEITTFSYPYLYARAAIEDCIPLLKDYSEASIPVLDEEEDLAEPVVHSVKKRLPWLCILLVMGLGVSATVGLFESIVQQLPVIMCFQSLILDMAGNVGTQSLAVAIRVLMDSQLGRGQKSALVWKELRIGLLNGVLLGALSFLTIGVYLCLTGSAPVFAFAVSGCLGAAMVLAMAVSSLSGTLIPIFFQRIGVDPAVASGPLITTVNDLAAVITYYGLSWLILLQTLHLT